jgi:hypothetical protein
MHKLGEQRKVTLAYAQQQEALDNIDLSGLEEYLENLYYILPLHATSPNEVVIIEDEIKRVEALIRGTYLSVAASASNDRADVRFQFPRSMDDYYNFQFGRDIHRLYNIYKDNFNRHGLTPAMMERDGANIFSHTFGPLLYNHDFSKILDDTLVTKKLIGPTIIPPTNSSFTISATDPSTMYVGQPEVVCSSILDGVELVHTSGSSDDSSFSIVNIPISEKSTFEDDFLYNKTFIIQKSGDSAIPRIRFDLSKYDAVSPYPIANNFLIPKHEYQVTLNSLVSNDERTLFGGRSVHIWIHTKPESGKMWSYGNDGKWVQHDQNPSRADVLQKYSHYNTNSETRDRSATVGCIDQVFTPPLAAPATDPSPLYKLTENDFTDFTVKFNTDTRHRVTPFQYQKDYGDLHRLNQEYVVEVFLAPGGPENSYMVVKKLEIQNLTMKKLSEWFVTGNQQDPLCRLRDFKRKCLEYRIELTKQDLLNIFKHFNDIAGKNAATGYASRDKNLTETIMESEGGSRLTYRYMKGLFDSTVNANQIIDNITIDG